MASPGPQLVTSCDWIVLLMFDVFVCLFVFVIYLKEIWVIDTNHLDHSLSIPVSGLFCCVCLCVCLFVCFCHFISREIIDCSPCRE